MAASHKKFLYGEMKRRGKFCLPESCLRIGGLRPCHWVLMAFIPTKAVLFTVMECISTRQVPRLH